MVLKLLMFCFTRVIDGLDTLDDLEKVPVSGKAFRPVNDVHLNYVTIHANPFADTSLMVGTTAD